MKNKLGSSFLALLVVLMVLVSFLGGLDVRREIYSLQTTATTTTISSEREENFSEYQGHFSTSDANADDVSRSENDSKEIQTPPSPEANDAHNEKHDKDPQNKQPLNHQKAQTTSRSNDDDDWLNYKVRNNDNNYIDSLPEPVQIVREYMAWHSNETLGEDEIYNGHSSHSRKYIVVPYNCPHQAGNGMTLFLNSFLMAIVTNRTLLWQSETGRPLTECDKVLHRAAWIPQALPERLPGGVESSAMPKWNVRTEIRKACAELFQAASQSECIDFFQKYPHRVQEMAVNRTQFLTGKKQRVVHQPMFRLKYLTGCWHSDIFGWWARFNLTDPTCRWYLKARLTAGNTNNGDEDNDNDFVNNDFMDDVRIQKLFRHGLYFLYGLLFDAAFRLTDELLASVQPAQQLVDPTAYSVAVHSRHISMQDDGSDISNEAKGLAHFVEDNRQQQEEKKCQILVMSDRTATTRAMYEYAQQHGCQAVALHPPAGVNSVESSASSSLTSTGATTIQQRQQRRRRLRLDQSDEHGPFAGAGFFQDLALVSLGRNGIVGSDRSSTALAVEKMAYNHVKRAWKQQQQGGSSSSTITKGEFCSIGGEGSRGYKCRSWVD